MEDKDIDRMLRDKLKGKITASPEMENKIKAKINEQKLLNKKPTKKVQMYKRLRPILSMAAIVFIVFAVGMQMNNGNIADIFDTSTEVASIKSIEPTNFQSGILASDSDFIITTEDSVSIKKLQESIYVEPALDYTIEKTGNKNEYKLTFKQNIPDNIIVKLQYVKNKITKNSWAYQTSNKLSVTEVYPSQYAGYANPNTVVEVELSYANVENFEENVSIFPNVEGNWEHLGKVWRFRPSAPFAKQKYTVTINKGIKAGEEVLENDYIFSFNIKEDDDRNVYYSTVSMDGIVSVSKDECAKIRYSSFDAELNVDKIEISKFSSVDDFIKYVDTANFESAKLLGEYDFSVNKVDSYIELAKPLNDGYYVAKLKDENGNEVFNCPIQANPLSAYAMETERDIVIWVANEKGLAKNVKVAYAGKEEKTNSDGIAKFEAITDGSKTIKYAKIGNDENPLVVGLYNFEFSNYPYGYLYTDRPVYKNTDTIKIWGFVPTSQFFDKIEDEFYIELGLEGKHKVKVEKDGNFNYEIKLNNHVDDDGYFITLYYKDNQIAGRSVSIENYGLENYSYEIIADKNYAYVGSNYEFDVKVKHVTGIVVPEKTVMVKFDENVYREKTGPDGIAHFSIYVDNLEYDMYSYSREIDVYNGDYEEYSGSETYKTLHILSRNVYCDLKEENQKFELKLYTLLNDKNTDVSYDVKELYDKPFDVDMKVSLVETSYTREQIGETYDEYRKEMVPEYRWNENVDVTQIDTISTKNGVAKYDGSKIEMKQSTEDVSYSYELNFEFADADGMYMAEQGYLYNRYNYSNGKTGYYYDPMYSSGDNIYEIPREIDTISYYTYRYFFETEQNKFKVGDVAQFTLNESIMDGQKPIENEGKILRIIFQEDISKMDIISNNDFDYKFTKEDFTGCKMTSAYYYNGRFYRMPIHYFDFDEKDRELDIEVKADKEKYAPGDEVTLKIKTSKDGKGIKTFANISVVNEAVFVSDVDEFENILECIYEDKIYPVYTYSSNLDYLSDSDGGGGGGGEPRGKFADTAYFETVYTDSKGEATVKFKLPENVTSYRATVHAANEDMYVGVGRTNVVSTLDFFVQSVEPRNVKETDDLVLNASSIASDVYDVDFTFTIKELDKTLEVSSLSNTMVTANFGKLPYGTYTAVIRGTHGNQTDAVEYKFKIVKTSQEIKAKTEISLDENASINPVKNPICLEIYNKNMSRYLRYLDFIASTKNARLDTQIAYNEMIRIKNEYYQTNDPIDVISKSEYTEWEAFKNLPNGEKDLVLTALISYYAKEYYATGFFENSITTLIEDDYNLFEIYLLAAANNKTVLNDLIYLKEADTDNYNRLLLTLSFEFLGDYQNAKDVYQGIVLSEEEANEYKSLVATIETFLDKDKAIEKIDSMIEEKPADEYLRFAILSFFKNSSEDLKEEKVDVVCGDTKETITLNGMQVQTYYLDNEDLNSISFVTSSKDLMTSYYYETTLEEAEGNMVQDMQLSLVGNLEKYSVVDLSIDFENTDACDIRIALPNSLRLAVPNMQVNEESSYYVKNNNIDYLVIHKYKDYNFIYIPLQVVYDGEYQFENIVVEENGTYHISNSVDFTVE